MTDQNNPAEKATKRSEHLEAVTMRSRTADFPRILFGKTKTVKNLKSYFKA
jgi:hypothetical protein